MRQVALIPNPHVRISILAWNGKFLLKFERPDTEQVFKLPESVVTEEEVKAFVNDAFVSEVLQRFSDMEQGILTRLHEIKGGK